MYKLEIGIVSWLDFITMECPGECTKCDALEPTERCVWHHTGRENNC